MAMIRRQCMGSPRECCGFLERSSAPCGVYAQNFEIEINDLSSWVSEIHSGDVATSNEFNNSNINFDDASSNPLLATTVYHLAILTGNKTFIPQAERTRANLQTEPPPDHHHPPLPLPPTPHQHQHHPHSRTYHTSRPPVGSLQ